MELASLISVARRWLVVLVAGLVVGGVLGDLYAGSQEPTYEATVRMLIGPINADANTLRAAGQTSQTYAELATNRALLRKAVGSLALEGADKAVVTSVASDVTRLLRVTARSNDPRVASAVANAVAGELVSISEEERELSKSDVAAPVTIVGAASTTIPTSTMPPGAVGDPPTSAGSVPPTTAATVPTTATTAPVEAIVPSRVGEVRVVDAAEPPSTPVAPNASLIRVLGANIGLLVAFALAVTVEYTRRAVRSIDDITEPVLGRVQREHRSLLARHSAPGWDAAATEAFRGIAVDLLASVRYSSLVPSVLVSGTDEVDATAEVAANLAHSLALAPMRVALVDVGGAPSARGVLQRIGGSVRPPEEPVEHALGERATLLCLGMLPNPVGRGVDLFELERLVEPLEVSSLERLSDSLHGHYDAVVLYAPPAFGSIVTVACAAAVDGCVLVVSEHHSRLEDMELCSESLDRYGARMLGVVFDERNLRLRLRRVLLRRRGARLAAATPWADDDAATVVAWELGAGHERRARNGAHRPAHLSPEVRSPRRPASDDESPVGPRAAGDGEGLAASDVDVQEVAEVQVSESLGRAQRGGERAGGREPGPARGPEPSGRGPERRNGDLERAADGGARDAEVRRSDPAPAKGAARSAKAWPVAPEPARGRSSRGKRGARSVKSRRDLP